MTRKKVSNKLVVVSLIIISLGVLVVLDVIGTINWLHKFSEIPVIGVIIPSDNEEEVEELISPLEIENENLQTEILALKQELTKVLAENNKHQQEIIALQDQFAELTAYKNNLEERKTSIEDLAKIYENMKPAVAAKIFTGLSDELVIDILLQMSSDQVTRILGQLEPELAGKLTNMMVN